MPQGLSVLARRWLADPAGARASLTKPALVWQAPSTSAGEMWDVTSVGDAMTRPTASEPVVFSVEKSQKGINPFAMGVTLGRVESNDIVIDDGSVSRFHAWLQHDEKANEWTLCDADSKNGTWHDGEKVSPGSRVKLKSGSLIRLGDAELTFFLPEGLLAFVDKAMKKA